MPGPIDFALRFGRSPAGAARRGEGPLRVLVLGDFGGARDTPLADRAIHRVDAGNIERLLVRLAPRLELPAAGPGGTPLTLAIGGFDAFHPDALYDGLALFQQLRSLRRRLLDPAQFSSAAAELRPAAATPAPPDEDAAAMLTRLLGRGAAAPATPASGSPAPPGEAPGRWAAETARFIARVVVPHLAPGVDPQAPALVAAVDQAAAAEMRRLLHDPAFQALEATWRGLRWLVESVEFGGEVELAILDAGREELAADLAAAAQDLSRSGLYRLLVDRGARAAGGQPWSLLLGIHAFGPSATDVALLAALGAVAAHAGGPFLAAAEPAVLGCRSLAETPDPADWTEGDVEAARRWQALRKSEVAPWLGLALPRVLLRRPYGRRSDPIERFAFDEIVSGCGHEAYLWGNPAYACAIVFARAFLDRGWAMRPDDAPDLDDLPLHTVEDAGERRLLPCAEVLLGDRAATAMLGRGVIPVLSHRNHNAVRIVKVQSIADPPMPLSGPWR